MTDAKIWLQKFLGGMNMRFGFMSIENDITDDQKDSFATIMTLNRPDQFIYRNCTSSDKVAVELVSHWCQVCIISNFSELVANCDLIIICANKLENSIPLIDYVIGQGKDVISIDSDGYVVVKE